MSLPQTAAEMDRARRTLAQRGGAENLVSTACPRCETRFSLLARLHRAGWTLRCVICGWTGSGELKH